MKLRDMVAADHEQLLDLWQESWQVTLPAIDFAARRPWFSDYLKGLVASGTRLRVAAAPSDVPLGFYTLDGQGYLDQIAVRRDKWGGGVAVALIADAKAQAPGRIDLKVNQANLRAIRFYEREGFVRGKADISPQSGLPLWGYTWTL